MKRKVLSGVLSLGGDGPPPIPNGRGKEQLLREEPYYDVHLDAGTFDWLWRIVEARAYQHQNHYEVLLPEVVLVSRKAVIAFRDAVAATGLPPPLPKKKRRVVKVPKIG